MELGKEEGGKRESPQGVLAQLESLERREGLELRARECRDRRKFREFWLRCRARELRLRRDRLREKLERLEKQASGKAGTAPDPTPPDPRDILEWRIRSLRALLRLFHLTGISGKLSKQGIVLTLSTSYENSQLDSFHLELRAHPQLRIHRHSIPAFIPLERLSREFLPGNLRLFLDLLSRHLNGFVGRKFQAEQFQERFSDWIQGIPHRNSLCNLLKFRYSLTRKSRNFPFQARLLYRDPCRSLPTDVSVSCSRELGFPAGMRARREREQPGDSGGILGTIPTWKGAGRAGSPIPAGFSGHSGCGIIPLDPGSGPDDPGASFPTPIRRNSPFPADSPDAPAAQLEQHSELFRKVPLHRAFQSLAGTP
ncbi:centromere protein O [Empidonax traillii]|uniref:centromere protein O n=1 Tax=Empidonax traillii TaxID=164674 RepID=UPI000FFCF889|nr:centromere protein O [Empidonax traillii]